MGTVSQKTASSQQGTNVDDIESAGAESWSYEAAFSRNLGLIGPQEQEMLHEVLNLEDPSEEQFYWGRLLGHLSQGAKDMLNAWRIRQWPKNQVKLLYELVDYVAFYQTG